MNPSFVSGTEHSVALSGKGTLPSPYPRSSGAYMGYGTSNAEGANFTQSAESGEHAFPKRGLRDRIAYPFRAIKNRIINSANLGGFIVSGLTVCVPMLVGAGVGGIAGGIVKLAKLIANKDSDALKMGAIIGGVVMGLLAALPSIAVGLVSQVAFAVVGLVASVFFLPVDIYHAATLDQSKLKPDHIVPRIRQVLANNWENITKHISDQE